MPATGPSVDRRSLAWACRAAQSSTVCSLICFGCAQQYTSVKCWESLCHDSTWYPHQRSVADIRMVRVSDSLLNLERHDPEKLASWFSLDVFRRRYARDDAASGNPFQSSGPWEEPQWEWRRELLLPAKEWSSKVYEHLYVYSLNLYHNRVYNMGNVCARSITLRLEVFDVFCRRYLSFYCVAQKTSAVIESANTLSIKCVETAGFHFAVCARELAVCGHFACTR